METPKKIRQPIITICGHVDHGKTSILDCLRSTSIQEGEAGGITQKISFTSYPLEQLKKACPLIEKSGIKLTIPGFLLIDTPGHAAFTNLRKRGGSLADLAVLVVDINDGIKPQTAEVIKILQHNKTPFLIAINKIDNISGWRNQTNKGLKESIETQPIRVKQLFDEKYMTLIAALNSYNLDADLFYNVQDFTKKIALVPTSARTREGIPELIMMICGLSQRYLENRLELHEEPKGVILEVKKEKSINFAEAIIYDGELSRNDEIAVASIDGKPIIAKIRILEEIQPLSSKFKSKDKVKASTGVRMQLSEKAEILPGMPFLKFKNNLKELEEIFKKEISETLNSALSKQGIIAKADSLGSLEALLVLLRESKIPVVKAGIGNISKTDIISAKANLDINELDAIIVGFNVKTNEDARISLNSNSKVKIIEDEVVYKLIENLVKFREERKREIEKERMMGLTTLAKLKVLHQYVFRNTKPAIFGVAIEAGKLTSGMHLIDNKGNKIGRLKNIQSENKSVENAGEGLEVAISIPGVNFEREIKDKQFIYSDLTPGQFKAFKKSKDLLSSNEIKILQEVAEIKRSEPGQAEWGI